MKSSDPTGLTSNLGTKPVTKDKIKDLGITVPTTLDLDPDHDDDNTPSPEPIIPKVVIPEPNMWGKLVPKNNSNSIERFVDKVIAAVNTRILMGTKGIEPEGPCLVMACLGVAQTYTGKILTLEEVRSILGNNKYYDKNAKSAGNTKAILSEALRLLGCNPDEYDISVAKPGESLYEYVKRNAVASLRPVGTELEKENAKTIGHWQEGDKLGNFVWDPKSGTDQKGRKYFDNDTRYVMIRKREK